MPVSENDLVFYGSAVMPESDAETAIGGAIDKTVVVTFTDLDTNGTVEAVSSAAGDTMSLTVTGRNAAGEIVSETKALNGTAPVAFSTTFKRLMKAVLASAAAGTVTLRKSGGGTTLMTFPAGVLTVRRVFYEVAADVAGGSSRSFYEKIFAANNNATDALTNAKISIQTNPGGRFAFALESVLDGSDTNGVGNNRQVAPAGYSFGTSELAVANGSNHSPEKAQGIWLRLTLPAGAAASADTLVLRETGTTAA